MGAGAGAGGDAAGVPGLEFELELVLSGEVPGAVLDVAEDPDGVLE